MQAQHGGREGGDASPSTSTSDSEDAGEHATGTSDVDAPMADASAQHATHSPSADAQHGTVDSTGARASSGGRPAARPTDSTEHSSSPAASGGVVKPEALHVGAPGSSGRASDILDQLTAAASGDHVSTQLQQSSHSAFKRPQSVTIKV